ncbi:MAG TPA: thioredoxin family protein [Candidatus Babeliales bacterium]|nr:thioredoxin family protein [Candidatus Babeliales bacterium]
MSLKQLFTPKLLLSLVILVSLNIQADPSVPAMIDSTAPAPQPAPTITIPAPAPDNLYTTAVKYLRNKKDRAVRAVKTRTKEITTAHKRHKDLPSGHVINILRPDQFYYYLEHAERKMLVVAQFIRSSCHNCPRINPSLQTIADQNIDVVFLNIDTARSIELSQLATQLNVSRYPTFLCFKAGRRIPVFRMFGTDVTMLTAEIDRLR